MYKATTHNLHPLLSALDVAISDTLQTQERHRELLEELTRRQHQVAPTAWTKQIENAIDKPDELEILRVYRQEVLITYESARLNCQVALEGVRDAHKRLRQAIGPLVQLASELDYRHRDRHLKPIIMNNVLVASQLLTQHIERVSQVGNEIDYTKTLAALEGAFDKLVSELDRHLRDHSLAGSPVGAAYPIGPAVLELPRVFDGRSKPVRVIEAIATGDCEDSQYHALKRLPELIGQMRQLREQARKSQHSLAVAYGQRDVEKQYAADLVDMLDESRLNSRSAQGKLDVQHGHRLGYESARTAQYATVLTGEAARVQLADALRQAIAETQSLPASASIPGKNATADQLFVRRLALVNCLAADHELRLSGRLLSDMYREYLNDLSNHHGQDAMESEFVKLAQPYKSLAETEKLAFGG